MCNTLTTIYKKVNLFSYIIVCIISIFYNQRLAAVVDGSLDPSNQLSYNIRYSAEAPLNQQVLILTDFGAVVILLNSAEAPQTTQQFTELIRSKYYHNTSFYRMYNNYFIQAGDPSESGTGNAGVTFPNETSSITRFTEGTVALAKSDKTLSSTGSQFFITFLNAPWLDGKYAILGRVISGLDTLRSFFGKYSLNSNGIMYHPIPLQIFILEDFMNAHPELKHQFIAMDPADDATLVDQILSEDTFHITSNDNRNNTSNDGSKITDDNSPENEQSENQEANNSPDENITVPDINIFNHIDTLDQASSLY